MARKEFTVADYLYARLKEVGVDHLFGVVGDFSLGLFHRAEKGPVKIICTCNELNAAYAADGYARVHGMGGVVSTYVVGELSAINGVAGAYAENVPLIKITGCPGRKHYRRGSLLHHTLGDYEIPLRMYRQVTAAAEVLDDPATATEVIDHLIRTALYERKPVYAGIPADLVMSPCKRPSTKLIIPHRTSAFRNQLKESIASAAALLNQAKRPLIVVDFEAARFGLEKEVLALIHKSGYPFSTMMLSKTFLDEGHPQFIGTYSGARSTPEVRQQVESSDAILAIGLKLTDFNSGGFSTRFPEETTVFAWLDHTTIGKTCHERVDLSEFLTGLTPKLQTRKPGSIPYMPAHAQQEYRAALRFKHQPSKRLTIQRFFERMTSYMGKDMVMIAETGTALFAGAAMTFQKGAQLMTQTFYGSIGYTVGATLGVALGAPKKRVVLVVGDGSFQLTAQEVSTMIRYGLDPIIFVINNDGYLVERVIGDGSFNDLQQWNYAQVPQAFGGGWGCKVKTEGELESALQRAIKQKGVSLIELIIDKWDSPPAMTSAGAAMARTNYLV